MSVTRVINNHNIVLTVAFDSDGRNVVSGDGVSKLRRWNVEDGVQVDQTMRTRGSIYSAVVSKDGRWIVTGDFVERVIVWDAKTHDKVWEIVEHNKWVRTVDISSDSTRFASGSDDRTVRIFSITTRQRLLPPLKHDGLVMSVKFSPNGDRIATATDDHSVRVYDAHSGDILFPIPTSSDVTALAWSPNGKRLFAASPGKITCLDTWATSSGSRTDSEWPIHKNDSQTSIATNGKFIACSSGTSVSLWDIVSHNKIGSTIDYPAKVIAISLSSDGRYLAGGNGTNITIHDLKDFLPRQYLEDIPLMDVDGDVLKTWSHNDLVNTESTLSDEIAKSSNPNHHMLANRALIRARLNQWTAAVKDAKRSLRVQLLPIGHIAMAIALAGRGNQDGALREFDLSFRDGNPKDMKLLLLLRSILLFTFGKHQDAILRVRDLLTNPYNDDDDDYYADDEDSFLKHSTSGEHTDTAPHTHNLIINANDDDAYCLLQVLGNMYLKKGEYPCAIEVFERAKRVAPPDKTCPPLTTISSIFNWSFEALDIVVQRHLCESLHAKGRVKEAAEALLNMLTTLGDDIQLSKVTTDWVADFTTKCATSLESLGDAAFNHANHEDAIKQYSTALLLNPINPSLLMKQSKARAAMAWWDDALTDANEAIEVDPSNHLTYQCQYIALHGAKHYDKAIEAFGKMLSLIEQSSDPKICELRNTYISPSQTIAKIEEIAGVIANISPHILIDVQTGRLCDAAERMAIFKSDPAFKELVSSTMKKLDEERILRVVTKFFAYAMFSHVWEGKEPSFQEVNHVQSVHDLPKTHMNIKLRRVCEEAGKLGQRFLWSDTCCIDKTKSATLNQSLTSMHSWYAGSVITIVFLAGVKSPSKLGDLANSKWMTRAWTLDELLAPKTIRFYDSQWRPYLGDTRLNHKESPEIMQELADAFRISRHTIITFSPADLSVSEKLRLASTRNATVEEDVAYSLIGIFKSDIRPHYGEREAALGHLLEEIVARSGEVTILAWTGESSSYNSCLPSTLSVYSQPPYALPTPDASEMETRTAELRKVLPREDAMVIYQRVAYLPTARFANRRLHLPSIIFRVRKLGMQIRGTNRGDPDQYRIRVSGLGDVDITTTDALPLNEPRRLKLVHPWISYIRGPRTGVDSTDDSDSDTDSESDSDDGTDEESGTSAPMPAVPVPQEDEYTRALKLIVRLGQPFNALLLLQQLGGEYKRVAAKNEIVVQGLGSDVKALKDIRAEVLEIL